MGWAKNTGNTCCAGNVKCEVVGFMRKLMNGGYYPWAPKSGAGYVDIDDVAAAHTLAMLTPQASGRCAIPNRPHSVSSHLAIWNGLWLVHYYTS